MTARAASDFWDRAIETMSPDALRERIELPKFAKQLRHAFANSPFWRERLSRAGISCDAVEAAVVRPADLPFLEKRDILEDQSAHAPFGRLPAVGADSIQRIHRTSGTTTKPFHTLLTGRDVETTTEAGARAFWCAGLRPGDSVVHCLNYCMWSGGVTDHLCLERTGATVIPFGVGNSRQLLDAIGHLKPSAISCTPSYLNRLAEVLRERGVESPATLGLRMALLGGEAGVQEPAFRDSIEREWNLRAIDANYGLSDVLSIFGSECRHRTGLHFHGQGLLLVELIDPRSLKNVDIEAGAEGEMVLTHLDREAQPLLRYRTRDVIRIAGIGDCPCGRGGFRFVVRGRSDDMLVVKGVNVFPEAFRAVISRFDEQLTGAYRVVVADRGPIDRVRLRLESRSELGGRARARLTHTLQERIRDTFSVRADIEWLDCGALSRSEAKTRLVVRVPST